jgi:hypothetical protein
VLRDLGVLQRLQDDDVAGQAQVERVELGIAQQDVLDDLVGGRPGRRPCLLEGSTQVAVSRWHPPAQSESLGRIGGLIQRTFLPNDQIPALDSERPNVQQCLASAAPPTEAL